MKALVIGAGLTGAVIARCLAEECNIQVTVYDRRDHIGGNMYDYYDEHHILVHKYGPHIFHTNDKKLFDYVNQFAKWNHFKMICRSSINGKITPIPFNFQTIDDFYSPEEAADLKNRLIKYFGDKKKVTVFEVLQAKEEKIRAYGQFLFENDYKPYTSKQWGLSYSEIDTSILERVPLRLTYEDGYFDDKYQALPEHGYTEFLKAIFDHPNIKIELGIEALDHLKIDNNVMLIDGKPCNMLVIYTGVLEELFSLKYGRLPYRSLAFEWKFENINSKQTVPMIAYPQVNGFTRIIEYKKLPKQDVNGTTYAIEFPISYTGARGEEPYYPVLNKKSQILYNKYLTRVKKVENLFCAGRLADFKYYNMDQVLVRALEVCETLKRKYGKA